MTTFKDWLEEEYGVKNVQKVASRFMRTPNPKDA